MYCIAVQSHPAAQEVHIGHPEGRSLTPPQAPDTEQQYQRVVAASLVGESLELVGGQIDVLPGCTFGQLDPAGRIDRQHPVFHGIVKDAGQDAVRSPHNRGTTDGGKIGNPRAPRRSGVGPWVVGVGFDTALEGTELGLPKGRQLRDPAGDFRGPSGCSEYIRTLPSSAFAS